MRALFGLHASFTISDKTLERAADAGHSLGAGFHVHTAEAQSDQDYNVEHYHRRPLRPRERAGDGPAGRDRDGRGP